MAKEGGGVAKGRCRKRKHSLPGRLMDRHVVLYCMFLIGPVLLFPSWYVIKTSEYE